MALLVLLLAAVVPLVGAVGASEAVCGGLEVIRLDTTEILCTHGDDTRFAAAQAEPTRTDRSVPATRERCFGEGINGPRVQVLYVHAAGSEDRLPTLRSDLLRWSRQVEWTVSASAQRWDGRRHVRWVTTVGAKGRCEIDIRSATVPRGDIGDFGRMVSALKRAGWGETDRKYLVFADDDTYCGLGSAPRDDRPGSANRSESGAGYARVDRRCWTSGDRGVGSTAAHEVMHTIGAVQDSAPHSTGAAHCTDEYDVMCYADGGAGVSIRCRDSRSSTSGAGDHNNHLLDCRGDDYFHPNPRSGTYLATHWNTATSSYLARRGSDGPGHRGQLRPDVTRDPRGRLQTWNGVIGGAHRPLLADAHGWESCDLPIDVYVVADEDQGVTALLEERPDPVLDDIVQRAAGTINDGTGRTLVRYRGLGDQATANAGVLVSWGDQAGPVAKVSVAVADARIRSAQLHLSRSRSEDASDARRTTFAVHTLAQALGLGTITVPSGDLMNPVPAANASSKTALAALRHLYATSCQLDARLDTVLIMDEAVAVTATPATSRPPHPVLCRRCPVIT